MNYDRPTLVGLAFLALTIGSALYVAYSAANYLQLYPALNQFQYKADSVQLIPGQDANRTTIIVHITVSNPTGYSGLRLGDAIVYMYFYAKNNDSNTLFRGQYRIAVSQQFGADLPPHSTVTKNVTITLNSQESNSLRMFQATYPGQVVASLSLTVEVITYFVSVSGRLPYTWSKNITIT